MSRYDQYSDEELIFRLRQGETEISDYLMEKYKEFVRCFLREETERT